VWGWGRSKGNTDESPPDKSLQLFIVPRAHSTLSNCTIISPPPSPTSISLSASSTRPYTPVHITIRSLILRSWCTTVIRLYIYVYRRARTFLLNRQCKQPASTTLPWPSPVQSPNIRYIVEQRLSNNSPPSPPQVPHYSC